MRFKLIIKVLSFFILVYTLTSCLEGDVMNTPPSGAPAIIQMTYNATGGTLVNSGLRYFGAQALTYPATHEADTATFAVTLQGIQASDKDITVTLATPADALDDYFYGDSIEYEMMPDSIYDILNTTAVIKAGTSYAEFKIKFYPSKFDPTKNLMLPVTATNSANLPTSSNYGFVYFHVIGNPIAGAYTWDFIRCSSPDCSGGPDGQTVYGRSTIMNPVNPTTVRVRMGYFDTPDYIITFKDNNGVLSDFKAVIDPEAVNGSWATQGIVVATPPTILVEDNNTKFTINFTTATRNCTDIYYK